MRAANNLLAAAGLALLPAAPAGAVEITRADLSGRPASLKADMVFSGALSVKNISFTKAAVVMPLTEYKGRTYADIKLLSKDLYLKLEACFSGGGCASKAKAPVPAVRVERIRLLRSGTRVANAEVSFDGELKVVLGIMKSRYGGEWVAYPPDFRVNDAALKSAIAKAVKDAYGRLQK